METRNFLSRFIVVLLVVAVQNCAEPAIEEVSLDFGYDYYPLEVGKFRIYELDSIIYDPRVGGTAIDSSTTLVREVIADSFTDNTGQTVFRVERSERTSEQAPWVVTSTVVLARDDGRAFWTEDNLRFIKMVFPLERGKQWDGHLFFDPLLTIPVAGESIQMFKDWNYKVLELGQTVTLGGQSFPDVATIELANSENLIENRQGTEQYAKGIGLIYRELAILDTQCEVCCENDFAACGALPWAQKAEKGFRLQQRLIDYN